MKRVLLTIIYPFWFFFAKTWFGNIFMIPIVFTPVPILFWVTFPELLATTEYEEAQGIGTGTGVLSLICSPFVGGFFMVISSKLESNYKKWEYKTEMKTEMI